MPDWLRDWWAAIALVVTIALVPFVRWVWMVRRKDLVTKEDLAAALAKAGEERRQDLAALKGEIHNDIRPDVEAHALRLALIEANMQHMPTRDDLQRLSINVVELTGSLKAAEKTVEGLSRLVERVEAQAARHEQIFSEGKR